MSTALQLRQSDEIDQWQVMREQAALLVKTNFLPQAVKTPEQALAIILTGRELGIGTMAALNNINVIAGKPTVSPQLMLALINSSKELEDISITDNGNICTVTMKRRGRKPHTESFSMEDAARMKTTEGFGESKKTIALAEKYNWKQMPVTMRKWRAVAACARIVFPDVILGLYTPDEMGADINPQTGEVIEMPIAPAHPVAPVESPVRKDLVTPDTLNAIEELWVKFGTKQGDSIETLNDYIYRKSQINHPTSMTQAYAQALLQWLQKRALAAENPAPATVEEPPTETQSSKGSGLDQWRCTQMSGARALAMKIIDATARLERTGVTEDQWRTELNANFDSYQPPVSRKDLSAEEAAQWLDVLIKWAQKREAK